MVTLIGKWEAESGEKKESARIHQSSLLSPVTQQIASKHSDPSLTSPKARLGVVKWLMQADWAIRAGTIFLSDGCVWCVGKWEGTLPLCLLFRTTSPVGSAPSADSICPSACRTLVLAWPV